MSSETSAIRYVVPIHLHRPFKKYLDGIGASSHQDTFLAVTLFTVFGEPAHHQKLQAFLKDCNKEKRSLIISNRKAEQAIREVEMWGLKLEIVKRGLLFTKGTVTGETKILDRLEQFLRTESIL